ncbi:OmpP1/FadL family transporter [Pontibacter cellulosilyticus]|uniref:Outer membrane protein transport protein n=1 Tax=Pontibacter cellulosilyticus TaxID=1720253 RepID=A0A923NAM2_9BACT|nr:outer membrane protein transport protein [Pontibacter cellulosilyticus]MBC5993932.1 outer membrane protein transport protein [Pontibacter cellulosilyticus]
MKSKLLAFLGSALLSGTAMAGGYQVNLASQRQIGMGHTGTGIQTGTSSIFFNPGALSYIRENGVTIGASAISSHIAYRGIEPTSVSAEADNDFGTPFQVYAAYKVDDMLTVGLGIYTPFGSGVKWGDQWSGRFALNQIDLQAIFFQPTVSYKIGDKLGLGVGFVVATGAVNLQRAVPVQNQDGTEGSIELDGSAKTGFGVNVGAFFQATEKLSIGIDYRSKIDLEVEEGDVIFSNIPAAARGSFPDGAQFSAQLPLPATLTLGVGYQVNDQLTLAADVSHVGWSEYESLRFNFDKPVAGSNFSESARNYEDAFIYRIGAEYQLNEKLALRGGAYYDQTPVQDGYLTPETPDADSRGLSAGIGYAITESFGVDASFLYINKKKRTDSAEASRSIAGTYKATAYIPGIALNYKF